MSIKQFRLSNGDEIICEVIAWPSEDQEELIIKRSLKVSISEDFENNTRYYSFKPWLVFQDDPDAIQSVNPYHIVVEANPSKELMSNYVKTLESLEEFGESDLTPEEADYLDKVLDKIREIDDNSKSDSENNVIKFKPKNTFH